MTLLHIIDTLCDVTTKQADLLRGAGNRSGTYEPGFRRSKELLSGEAGFY